MVCEGGGVRGRSSCCGYNIESSEAELRVWCVKEEGGGGGAAAVSIILSLVKQR